MNLVNLLRESTRDPFFIDSELYLEVQELIRRLQRLYVNSGRELPVEYRNLQRKIEEIYEQRVKTDTDSLCRLLQKSDKWLEAHPSHKYQTEKRFYALAVYIGTKEELKLRGISEYEALKRAIPKVNEQMVLEVFEGLIEVEGGDKK